MSAVAHSFAHSRVGQEELNLTRPKAAEAERKEGRARGDRGAKREGRGNNTARHSNSAEILLRLD